jgi:HEAT repeat protein
MAATVTPGDLAPWQDPDRILEALGNVSKGDVENLASAIAGLLDHEDADVREEAARALFVVGKNSEYRSQAMDLLRYDLDVAVRSAAAYGAAATSSPATRDGDVEVLVSIIRDNNENVEVRRSAYEALLILFRRTSFPAMNQVFNPLQDIDWQWLDSVSRRPEQSGDDGAS